MTSQNPTTETTDESASEFFRCPVQADQGDATIRIGRRRQTVTVQETSIDGFTVLVPPSGAKHLKVGKPWVLDFDGTRFEVHAQWFFHAPDGHVQVGLRRLRDLTQPDPIKVGWWSVSHDARGTGSAHSSTLAFAGFVMFLITAMAMPGLGDKLGTADPMGDFVKTVFDGIGGIINKVI